MNRRNFSRTGTEAFFIAAAGKAIGNGTPSARVYVALAGRREKGRDAT